jgi:hypothetical protein
MQMFGSHSIVLSPSGIVYSQHFFHVGKQTELSLDTKLKLSKRDTSHYIGPKIMVIAAEKKFWVHFPTGKSEVIFFCEETFSLYMKK